MGGCPSTDEVWKEYIEKRSKILLNFNTEADAVPEIEVDVSKNTAQGQLMAVRHLFPSCFAEFTGRVINEGTIPTLKSL
jgi:hypothetical protein